MVTFMPTMRAACLRFLTLFGETFKLLVFFYVESWKSVEMDLQMFLNFPLEQSSQNEWGPALAPTL